LSPPGRINIDKLNSGEEILLVAPAEYGLVKEKLDDGSTRSHIIHYTLDPNTAYSAVYQNDMFRAGDAITVSLLYCDNPKSTSTTRMAAANCRMTQSASTGR
jgi:hypothetical protein